LACGARKNAGPLLIRTRIVPTTAEISPQRFKSFEPYSSEIRFTDSG